MFRRKFVFSLNKNKMKKVHSHDLQEVIIEDAQCTVVVKEHIIKSKADSFHDGLDIIGRLTNKFIPGSVTMMKIYNEHHTMFSECINTESTFMGIVTQNFEFNQLDNKPVLIEIRGDLNPFSNEKGRYIGVFKDSVKEDKVELYFAVSGKELTSLEVDEDGYSSYESELVTNITIIKKDNDFLFSISYVNINNETGMVMRNKLISNQKYTKNMSLPSHLSNYESCIQKGFNLFS